MPSANRPAGNAGDLSASTLEAVLRRDRLIVAGALGIIIALAWGYVLWLANDMDMGGMDMTGFRMIPAGMGIMLPATAPWKAIEFAYVFAMWAVMMVGMMAPSAAPMILMYARVGRQGKAEGKPFAATGWFATGYFLTWIGFSLVATLVQWAIERATLLDSRMASASSVLGGIVLIARATHRLKGVSFSKRTSSARSAIQSTFITPPTNKSPIRTQQQPTQ